MSHGWNYIYGYKIFVKNILSKSNIHFLIVLYRIMVGIYFYLIYYTFVLKFTLKKAISFINAIAFRKLLTLFNHKFFSVALIN